MLFHLLNLIWEFRLFYILWEGILHNVTINEKIKQFNYSYLQDPQTSTFFNPFDKGFSHNLKEILFPQNFWFTMYHVPKEFYN